MIIKPYINWPKLSTLKIGDTIKWKDNEIEERDLNPEYYYIVIEEIKPYYHIDDDDHILLNGWYAYRFEVKIG